MERHFYHNNELMANSKQYARIISGLYLQANRKDDTNIFKEGMDAVMFQICATEVAYLADQVGHAEGRALGGILLGQRNKFRAIKKKVDTFRADLLSMDDFDDAILKHYGEESYNWYKTTVLKQKSNGTHARN
jgi:hypothetical protein